MRFQFCVHAQWREDAFEEWPRLLLLNIIVFGLACTARYAIYFCVIEALTSEWFQTPQLTEGLDVTLNSLLSCYIDSHMLSYMLPACHVQCKYMNCAQVCLGCGFDVLVAGLLQSDMVCVKCFFICVYMHLERRVALLSVSFRCPFFSSSVCFRVAPRSSLTKFCTFLQHDCTLRGGCITRCSDVASQTRQPVCLIILNPINGLQGRRIFDMEPLQR